MDHSHSKDSQLVSNCNYLLLFIQTETHSQKSNKIVSLFIVITVSGENLVQFVPITQLKKVATCCSKQDEVLLCQYLELRAK